MTRRKFIRTVSLVSAGLLFADSYWFERSVIEYNKFYLGKSSKNTNNLKLIQLSDLHLHGISTAMSKLAKDINVMKPDLILITGDAIDKRKNLQLLSHFLSMISLDIAKVAILGNWEHYSNVDIRELLKVYAANNCKLLINETHQLLLKGKTVSITGTDDFAEGTPDIKTALQGYRQSDYHFILTHCPQYYDEVIKYTTGNIPVDCVLAGHTHGGQVNLFGFTPYLPKGSGNYVKGWYQKNEIPLYVSKGVGTTLLPVRFGARAEIAIFHLLA